MYVLNRTFAFKMTIIRGALVLSLVCLLGVSTGWAQNDASIRGVVTDASGAVIPGADITVTNVDTDVSQTAVSREDGSYSVLLLKEGTYKIQCSLTSFQSQVDTVILDKGQTLGYDFKLEVGKISEVVEVRSQAARIQQQPLNPGTVIEEYQIHELPLDGRNYLTLANLSPGIIKGRQGTRGEQTAGEGGFRSGGLAMDQTTILVDGADNSARTVQGPLITQAQTAKPAIEAISEFKIVTNNISAEYGYKAGAQVHVSTKSGTNTFHGGIYEFHRNRAVAANNFIFNRDAPRDPTTNEITQARPQFLRNQFGGTIGGPIVKDKTFWFFSFQGTRVRNTGNTALQSVPSTLALSGDFSQELNIGNGSPNIFDPLTLTGTGATAERKQFPGNIIPKSRMDPVAVRFLNAVAPVPNVPGREFQSNNFFFTQKNRNDNEVYDARVDENINDNHRVFGRYSHRNEDSIVGGFLPFPSRASNIAFFTTDQFAINYNATLGPRMNNEFRTGYTRFLAQRNDEHTENLNDKFGIKNAAVSQFPDLIGKEFLKGLAFIFFGNRFSPLGGGSGGGTNTTRLTTINFADNFFINFGKHSLKFGGEYRRWRSDRQQGNIFGTFNVDGRFTSQFPNSGASRLNTGNTLADALLGYTSNTNNGLPVGEDLRSPYWGFYVQDDWRVTPRLTVNLGLRWELFKQPSHASFDATTPVAKPTFTGNLRDESSPILPITFAGFEFPNGTGDCGCVRDTWNFGPRVGIAYRVFDHTVIRAGGGIYYSENGTAQLTSNRFLIGGPNIVSLQTPQGFETTNVFIKDGFPDLDITPGDPSLLRGAGSTKVPDFQPTINSAQWFLDIQHQLPYDILLTLGYNGQAQSHLTWWIRNVAAPLTPGVTSFVARRRVPQPNVLNSIGRPIFIFLNENILNANYNAATAKIEKRFSRGLSFTQSLTWGRSLDFGVSSLNSRGEGISPGRGLQPPSQFLKDIGDNYGPSGLNRNVVYNGSVLYQLPAGPGKGRLQSGPASWVLGGWQVGAIISMQTGPKLTHIVAPNRANTFGSYRGNLVGNPNFPVSQRDSTRWFNAAAFAPGDPGVQGNAGRGLIDGPGFKNLDFLASKNFPMPIEGHHLEFRFEAFNFTNTAHLGAPSVNASLTTIVIGNPNSVRINQADNPRIIQFALKYLF